MMEEGSKFHKDDDDIIHEGIPYVLAYGGRIPHHGRTATLVNLELDYLKQHLVFQQELKYILRPLLMKNGDIVTMILLNWKKKKIVYYLQR